MSRVQAKFLIAPESHERLKHESKRSGFSMSTIVNLLIRLGLPPVGADSEPGLYKPFRIPGVWYDDPAMAPEPLPETDGAPEADSEQKQEPETETRRDHDDEDFTFDG